MTDHLGNAYPVLAEKLRKTPFAALPTPVSYHEIQTPAGKNTVSIKHDDQTNSVYGGNKIRKLEYIFQRAIERGAKRVATFGAAGSNHALATAIFAKQFGLGCTCFLAHQKYTPAIQKTLAMHLQLGTEIVRYGGSTDRVALFRRYLQNRQTWVIPLGGTCWLSTVGFVNAGLELAAQIDAGEIGTPDRIYIANGTMGSSAGLALGLALARLPTEVHAIRVADRSFVRRDVLDKLMRKTAMLLNRLDPSFPADLADRSRVVWRDEFYAGGYAAFDDATVSAVELAKDQLQMTLETTYTGKALAALLHDLENSKTAGSSLFWNTYNSRTLPDTDSQLRELRGLPQQFRRYFD